MLNLYEIISEELNNIPNLCDLDIEQIKNNYDESIFGNIDDHLVNSNYNKKISKSLCLNNKVIGGYLLNKSSMLSEIKNIYWYYKNTEDLTNLKLHISKNELKKYSNKRGIFSQLLYIEKEYRNNNYSKILINYAKSLGDYVWGGSVKGKTDNFWTLKEDRIKIIEYNYKGTPTIITATKI